MSIDNPAGDDFAVSDFEISLHDVACENPTGTIDSFTCTLPSNLPVQSHRPRLLIKSHPQYGFVSSRLTVTPPLEITGVSPDIAETNGGAEIVVTGKGFVEGVSVYICNQLLRTLTIDSYEQLTVRAPACETKTGEEKLIIRSSR